MYVNDAINKPRPRIKLKELLEFINDSAKSDTINRQIPMKNIFNIFIVYIVTVYLVTKYRLLEP